ncbi:phage protein NinX family protein [Morganella morganii]|uniref:phage protein NinX family protein n=1 Tax=Morganella morganii TaxID=582 RepID=UPI0031AADA24
MNKYRDKSDFEINKAVAEIIHPGKIFTQAYSFGDTCGNSVQWIGGYAEYIHVDFCKDPADAMPIVIENKICMAYDVFAEERDGGSWVAQPAYGFSDERVRSDNYYRAAMICFLMMKDAENEKS